MRTYKDLLRLLNASFGARCFLTNGVAYDYDGGYRVLMRLLALGAF